MELTQRQRRELEYHRVHAQSHEMLVRERFAWDVLDHPGERWWNAYWQMYAYLMPTEALTYESDFFGCIVARDILHHVDIPLALQEIRRVSKRRAALVVNEIYSHSLTNHVRYSALVTRLLYLAMRRFIYGHDTPYIAEDERKLTEADVQMIAKPLRHRYVEKYFNFLVTRVLPDRYDVLAKIDRVLLLALGPAAHLLAGRVLVCGQIIK